MYSVCNRYHYWGEDCELIVNEASLTHVCSLKSNLKATATHPKGHTIHINSIRLEEEGGDLFIREKAGQFTGNMRISFGVFKEWQRYFNFLSTSRSNISSQSPKKEEGIN